MKREQIRKQWGARTSEAPQTKDVSAFGADFILHKLGYHDMQEARAGGMKGETFDATQHLLALVVMSAKDEDGLPVFEKSDLESLLTSDGAEMDRLVHAALVLNNLTNEAREEGKEGSPATTAGGVS